MTTPALSGHLWQAYSALRRQDYPHAEEHLRAAMNLADPDPGSGLGLTPLEPCLLTGQNHRRADGGEATGLPPPPP